MKIIGLSGGVASGKNFVADIFEKNGADVFDADKEVHKLLEFDKSVVDEVGKKFPESFVKEKIDRKILGKIVFENEKKLKILEKIIHFEVRKKYQEFLESAKKKKLNLVVLNIPLLLENKAYKCDFVVAVIASKALQKKRFLERAKKLNPKNFAAQKKNLEKRFAQIAAKQMPDSQRKNSADFVIDARKGKNDVEKQVEKLLSRIVVQK
jgi:dephospho-CoA kinase